MSASRLLLAVLLLVLCHPAAPRASDSSVVGSDTISFQTMGENLCAITFDDGPGPYTDQLLDRLDEYGIQATFFMLGRNAERHPDIVRRALAEGHEVGSHSYSHPNLKTCSPKRRWDELSRTNDILHALGAEPKYLRPPYGEKDQALVDMAAELGLRVITWSRDSLDWKRLPSDYSRLPDGRGRIAPAGQLRGIFLFHDIHKTTVDDLPRIVAQLRSGGCDRFVTVSDYLDMFFCDPEPPILMTRRMPSAEDNASADHFWDVPPSAGPGVPDALGRPVYGRPAVRSWNGLVMDEGVVLERPAGLASLFATAPAPRTMGSDAHRPFLPFFQVGRKAPGQDGDGQPVLRLPLPSQQEAEPAPAPQP